MSAEYRTVETDEWVATRWAHRGPDGTSMGLDFGADLSRVLVWREAAPQVVDEAGRVFTWAEFMAEVAEDPRVAWTFGEFGGSNAVGSGDIAAWEGM